LAGRQAGLGAGGFTRLGNALLLAISLALPTIVLAEIIGLASDEPAASAYARALLGEGYEVLFWAALAALFLAAVLLWRASRRGRLTPRVTVSAGVMAQAAAFLHHYLLLVAWQTHGLALPYTPGAYAPTWIEYAVVLGIVALCLLLLLPSVRLIPFAPLVFQSEPVAGRVADRRRTVVTSLWLSGGLAISGLGMALSARTGTDAFQDPLIAGSPVVFIVGLVILATTGAVYELLPDRKP
jgi:Ni/Fe-hydrogenase subunit HybB-like protein